MWDFFGPLTSGMRAGWRRAFRGIRIRGASAAAVLLGMASALAAQPLVLSPPERGMARDLVIAETLKPYSGQHVRGVDTATLDGKVVCGYQGWFNCEGDGAGLGWIHWGRDRKRPPGPGNITIDLWPDTSELGPGELYPSDFRMRDGRPAMLFSSFNHATVVRHFRWMREHGIDSAFVQRFLSAKMDPLHFRHKNVVLHNCRDGANLHGRGYAVMYDLSSMKAGQIDAVIEDWRLLVGKMRVTADRAYQRHKGKPVVAVWGFGFKDREVTVEEGLRLVRFLKEDREFGGACVMLGVPAGWRRQERDCIRHPQWEELMGLADIISPWAVGRYRDAKGAARYVADLAEDDLKWCAARGKDFMPVVFPGFSWYNMKKDEDPKAVLDQIPREGGKFLWSQYVAHKRAGAKMIYQAMFDEVDEGTAIFKCTNTPPGTNFMTYGGLPSDFYLKLVGAGGELLRGEIPAKGELPRMR